MGSVSSMQTVVSRNVYLMKVESMMGKHRKEKSFYLALGLALATFLLVWIQFIVLGA